MKYAFNENKEIEFSPDSPIILPMVPKSYISYHYNYTPGVIGNYSHKFNALREIQEKTINLCLPTSATSNRICN